MSDAKEVIQDRLLASIDDTYDKTVGSFIYDVETPLSIELEMAYADQDAILDKGFADTSTGVYLEKIVSAYGIARKSATYATTIVTITGTTGSLIKLGDKVASDNVNFVFAENKAIDHTGTTTVDVICDTPGTIGNITVGAIKYFPVTLAGLVNVTNLIEVTNGYEEETDEELRQRYWNKVRKPATSGNSAQYKVWAKEISGVGDAKVTPLWAGNGTVKIEIIDNNKRAADATLIDAVSDYIEDNRPIGATITVVSAIEKVINVSVLLSIDTNNYVIEAVTTAIENILIKYFKDIAFLTTYVSYAKVGSLLFDIPGVIDYNNLLINGVATNINVNNEEIAVLGVLTNG